MSDLDRTIDHYLRHGWAPAAWAHHPRWVKAIIRRGRFRPKIKSCFENCARFMLATEELDPDRLRDLCYCEGWAMSIIPIEHAWLSYRGSIIDLTITDGHISYGKHRILTIDQVRAGMVRTETWGPFTCTAEINPYLEAFHQGDPK